MITLSWSCRLQQISFLALVLLSIANGQELVVKQQEISLDDATIILDCDSIDDVYWTVPPNFIKQQTNRLTVTMDSAKKYGTYKCFSQSAESSAATLIQTHELIRPVININLNESLTFVNLTKPYTIICPLNFGSKNTNWFRFDRNSQKWIQTRQNDWTTYQLASVTEADVTLWRCESANDFPVNGRRAASLFLSKGFAISSSVKLIARSELEAELIVLNEDQSKFLLECESIKTSPDEITWELKSILNSSTNNDYKRLGLDDPSVQREDNQNNIEITFEQHNLQISKCQPYNSGVYRCTLTDDSKRYARVHVKRKEPIIDRFGRQGAQKKVVNKGENVIFHCNYDKESVDVSNLMWTFRPLGSEMDVSSTVEYVIERPTSDGISVNIVGDRIRIEIQSFKTSNQGRYFCKFGEITDYTDVTVGADFDVQLIIKPAGTELMLTLTCSVTKNGIAESNNNYTFSYYEEFDANETRLANNRVARYGSKDRHFLCKATNRISKQTASSSPIQVRGIILTLVSDTPTGLRVDSPLTLRCVSSDSSIDNKMLRLNLGRFSAPRSSTTSLSDGTANFNYATVTKRRHSGDFQCVLDKTTIKSNIVKVVVCEKNELLCRDALLCYAANKNCDGRKDCADGSDEDRNRCMDCEPHSLKCQPINGRNPDVKCVLKHWICDGQNDCGNNWDEFADNGYCNKHPIPIQNCNACGRNETCCSDGKCFPRAYECDSEIDCSVDSIDETSCTCGQSSQLDIDDPLVEIVKPVAPGDSVEITCQVRGKERPTINWRFNWGHLPDDVRFVESMTTEQVLPAGGTGAAEMYTVKGKLLINNVNPKTDIGRYTCEAVTKCKRRLVPDYILRLDSLCQNCQQQADDSEVEDDLILSHLDSKKRLCKCGVGSKSHSTLCGRPCECKRFVIGEQCESCMLGYFGPFRDLPDGCLPCYCNQRTSICDTISAYNYKQIDLIPPEKGHKLVTQDVNMEEKGSFVLRRTKNGYDVRSWNTTVLYIASGIFSDNQLRTYGGNFTYSVQVTNGTGGQLNEKFPTFGLESRQGEILWHWTQNRLKQQHENVILIKINEASFISSTQKNVSRDHLMMVLQHVQRIFIRTPHFSQQRGSVKIFNFRVQFLYKSVASRKNSLEQITPALRVEKCRHCIFPHRGLFCDKCAVGFQTHFTYTAKQGPQMTCNNVSTPFVSQQLLIKESNFSTQIPTKFAILLKPHSDHVNIHNNKEHHKIFNFRFPHRYRRSIRSHNFIRHRLPLQSSISVNVGDTAKLKCLFGEDSFPTPNVTWSRDDKEMPKKALLKKQNSLLYIPQMTSDDEGVYVCLITNILGQLQAPINVFVKGRSDVAIAVIQKKVITSLAMTVEFNCNLYEYDMPTMITWVKKSGGLPVFRTKYGKNSLIFKIEDVQKSDAGSYICQAQYRNGQRKNIVFTLVTRNFIPRFNNHNKSQSSYLRLSNIYPPFFQFNFVISFLSSNRNGMIFYATNRRISHTQDYFVALGLEDGFLVFKFNLGSGSLILRSSQLIINMTSPITARFERHRKNGKLTINNQITNGIAPGLMQGLDFSGNVYLGCVATQNWTSVSLKTGFTKCFTGIVTRLLVNSKVVNFGQNVATKGSLEEDDTAQHSLSHRQQNIVHEHNHKFEPTMLNVQPVDTCHPNPCFNGTKCVVFHNAHGFICTCSSDYTGDRCDRVIKHCTPKTCNNGGKCFSNFGKIRCLCFIGRVGNRCQQGINITIPNFNGHRWLATRPLFSASHFNIALSVRPSNNSDGVLLYSGQTVMGTGDYFVVHLQGGHLVMSFNSGTGPVIIRSTKLIPINAWSHIVVKKVLRIFYIIINSTEDATVTLPLNSTDSLDLWTPLYIGGVNLLSKVTTNLTRGNANANYLDLKMGRQNELAANGVQLSEEIRTRVGFKGCIRDLTVNDEEEVDNTKSEVIASDGIENCTINGCVSAPCHRGLCMHQDALPGYRCLCPNGFIGQHCFPRSTTNCTENYCENNGICRTTHITSYRCYCLLGYAGKNCQRVVHLTTSARFQGNGYVTLSEDLFSTTSTIKHHFIQFKLRTNSSEGLIIWQGHTPDAFEEESDYIGVGVRNGRIFISLQLGGVSASLTSKQAINDNREHAIKIARIVRSLSIEVDRLKGNKTLLAKTPQRIGTRGYIYVGGVPQSQIISLGFFPVGFVGCIKDLKLQSSAPINFLAEGVLGYNVANC